MAAGDIVVRWVSESSAAIRDMKRVETALGDTMSKTEKWRSRLDKAATIGTAAFAAMIPAAIAVTNAASDQEQAIGSLNAVFKDHARVMETAADTAVESAGLSKTQYAQMATVIGAQLGNLGFDLTETTGLTQDLITKGADMAAMFGGTTLDAVNAISSALRGERDPIERYGVSLNQAAINAEKAGTNLTDAEAAIRIINRQLEKSGTAGAAAREYDSFAASTQRLKSAWSDFLATVGSGGKTGESAGVIEDLTKALRKLSDWIKDNPDAFDKISKGIIGVTAALVGLKTALVVSSTLSGFAGVVKKFPKASGIGVLIGLIVALQQSLKDVDSSADGALGSLRRFWDIKAPFSGGWWLTDMIDGLKEAYNWIEKLVYKANYALPKWLGGQDAPIGIGGGGGGVSRTAVGALQPAAGTSVQVFVAGERRHAVIRTEPAWAPHLTMGVM